VGHLATSRAPSGAPSGATGMAPCVAMVLFGINNIFTVLYEGKEYDCVLKGKVLKGTGRTYAPLAPGDEVVVDFSDHGFSRIESRVERSSEFSRWNRKRKAPQTLTANADLVVCVSSFDGPPFRPRFIDRAHVTCEIERLPMLVVLNKSDLGTNDLIEERIDVFRSVGCEVIRCSAETGEGCAELGEFLKNRRAVFCGQSGVGKTSVLNRLFPGVSRPVGSISPKHNRGRHTTRFGILMANPGGGWVVDTPGIREFEIVEVELSDLSFFFPEMVPFLRECAVPGCTHEHEPDCAVCAAVEDGSIHEDRYESYLRLLYSLKEREEMYG
jgi:ribosome biogenesis GTPase / thiamine phosphate phosphatase